MKAVAFIVAFLVAVAAFAGVTYMKHNQPTQADAYEEFQASLPKPSESGPQPKLVIAEPGETFEFGEMLVGDSMSHTFIVRNEGEGDLEMEKVYTTCKCTLGEVGESAVPPGGETEVVLTWTPKAPAEEFGQTAEIATNDPEVPKLKLYVKGSVLQGVSVIPAEVWPLGTISENLDAPSQMSGVIISQAEEEFEVIEVVTDNPAVEATISKITSQDDLDQVDARAGAEVTIKVKPEIAVGRFAIPVVFKTTSKKTPEVTITVGGTRSGPFTVLGRGWLGAQSRLNLKRFPASEGVKRDLLMLVEKADQPLEFQVESVTPEILNVAFTKDEEYEHPELQKYTMSVSVPPGVRQGAYEAPGERVDVRVAVNHPRFSELNFEVAFRAE